MVTLGEQGARLGADHVPAFPATSVDSTGAGDAFCAAFAVALAEGSVGSGRGALGLRRRARTWSSTRAWCRACRRARSSSDGLRSPYDSADRRHGHRRRRRRSRSCSPSATRGRGWRRSPSAAGTSPSRRRSRTRSTRSRWPAEAATCRSTRLLPAADRRVGRGRVRPRPGRDGRLVLSARAPTPGVEARRRTSSFAGSTRARAS